MRLTVPSGSGSGMSIGGTVTSGTDNLVLFIDPAATLAQDADFSFDNAANRLAVPNITGGAASGGDLTLTSTTDATKGTIFLDDPVDLWPSMVEDTVAVTHSPTLVLDATTTAINYWSPNLTFTGGGVTTYSAIHLDPTVEIDATVTFLYRAFEHTGTFTSLAAPIFYTFALFRNSATFTSATASVPPISPGTFVDASTVEATANNVGALATARIGFHFNTVTRAAGATAVFSAAVRAFNAQPSFNSTVAAGALTISNYRGFMQAAVAFTTTGTVTVDALVGYEFANQSQTSGNRTVTLIKALNLLQNTGASTTWNIFESGTAPNCLTGLTRLGDTTTPTAALDFVAGQDKHIRMGGHTANPATPTAGDIWYRSDLNTMKIQTSFGTHDLVGMVAGNAADSNTVSSTAAETNFTGTVWSIPANTLKVGNVIRVIADGKYSTTLSPTLNIRLKYGTVNLVVSGDVVMGTGVTDRPWLSEFYIQVRTIGATGTVQASGWFTFNTAATAVTIGTDIAAGNTGTVTIDTTATTTLQLSADWSASSASNAVTIQNFIVEVM